jgi:hypothetical protein
MTSMTQTFHDLTTSELIEHALSQGEGILLDNGALQVSTGKRTGRSPADRFIVHEDSSAAKIDWGTVNKPFPADKFNTLWDRVEIHLEQICHYIPSFTFLSMFAVKRLGTACSLATCLFVQKCITLNLKTIGKSLTPLTSPVFLSVIGQILKVRSSLIS